MSAHFRKAEPSDISVLASRLRRADLNELQASTGEHPVLALRKAYAIAEECHTILVNNEIAGMFGKCEGGVVWMVGSDLIADVPITFLRQSRQVVDRWLQTEPVLWNFLDERNAVHIQWIKWLGFVLTGRSITLLDPSVKFLEFVKCVPLSSP